MIEWGHTIVEILGVAVPIIIYMAANRYSAKRENDKRHEENRKKLNLLIVERMFLAPHGHTEKAGPLHAEGVVKGDALKIETLNGESNGK